MGCGSVQRRHCLRPNACYLRAFHVHVYVWAIGHMSISQNQTYDEKERADEFPAEPPEDARLEAEHLLQIRREAVDTCSIETAHVRRHETHAVYVDVMKCKQNGSYEHCA